MRPILAYYTNVIFGHHTGSTDAWRVAALDFVVLAFMRSILVAARGAVGCDSRHSGMGHGKSSVITPFSSGV